MRAIIKCGRAVSRSKPSHTHNADDSLTKLRRIACGESTLQMNRLTALNRENLYKALSGKSQPKWDTVQRIIKALKMNVRVAA